MKLKISILLILFGLFCTNALAYRIPKPAKIVEFNKQSANQLNQDLENLWDLTNGRYSCNIVTSNPDNSIRGNVGDILLFNNSGTYYLAINVGGTVWKSVLLQDIP